MLATFIGMAVEVEEYRFRRAAPDVLQVFPVEPGVDIEIFVHLLQHAQSVGFGAADELGGIHVRCGAHVRLSSHRREVIVIPSRA